MRNPYMADLLTEHGLLYFETTLREIERRTAPFPNEARAAVAAACATRLMHVAPHGPLSPFSLQWSEHLDAVWHALLSNDPPESAAVLVAITALDVARAPEEVDNDEVAASIYAAQAFCATDTRAWYCAATRLVDHAFSAAGDQLVRSHPNLTEPQLFVEQAASSAVQSELRLLLAAVTLLETQGPITSTYQAIQRLFLTA